MSDNQALSEELIALLQCPLTQRDLSHLGVELSCADGEITYPLIEGVPWLLPNPQNSLADWSAKLNHFGQVLLSEIKTAESNIKHAEGESKKRFELLLNAKQNFLKRVAELLMPLLHSSNASKNIYDALRDRAPNTQNLLSYEANLYRDWVWGEEENNLTADMISNLLQPEQCNKLLVLGAGAGKLALDLHEAWQAKLCVATDINPLLVLAANYLLKNKSLPFVEFPSQPRRLEYSAVEYDIQGRERPDNFFFMFADATKPCFKAGAFDTVVTPWFIDIQPLEFGKFLRQLNHYLPIGGQWINFGSLVFNQKRDALCYSLEEVKEIALKQGFEIKSIEEKEVPYLKSPYNAGHRVENVWLWRAEKIADTKTLNNPQVLAPWLLDLTQAIPKAQYIEQFAFTHRVYAQLAAEVDGKTSINKIAKKIAKQNRLEEREALHLVNEFFIDLYRQNH
ncbi:MAG: hypothetical protein K6L76_12930 [Agarilytica sp.]